MNTEFPKQVPEKSQKEFELDYKPFDPEVELKNIRQGDKEAQNARLEKYKNELIKQKEGIAEIQTDLENQIRKNPDLSQEELIKTVLAKAPKYKLSENQLALFQETLNKYVERHQAVREARKKYPRDKELFKACFGKEPTGFVEIMERPANLHFRCDNLTDYAWIYKLKFSEPKQKQNITMSDIKSADKTGGFFLSRSCLLPSLNYAITVEKTGLQTTNRPKSERIIKHEEQHSIYKLFKEQRLRNSIERILTEPEIREKINQELRDKKSPKILVDYLRTIREDFENFAKNEILAFYKSGDPFFRAIDHLLMPRGLLDYFYQNKEYIHKILQNRLTPETVKRHKKEIERILKQVFVDEYHQELFDNVYAIRALEKMGKSRNEIIYLLITEPLSRWSKLVERIKTAKK